MYDDDYLTLRGVGWLGTRLKTQRSGVASLTVQSSLGIGDRTLASVSGLPECSYSKHNRPKPLRQNLESFETPFFQLPGKSSVQVTFLAPVNPSRFTVQKFFSAHFKKCPATVNLVPLPRKILCSPFKKLFFPPTPANTNGPAGWGKKNSKIEFQNFHAFLSTESLFTFSTF